MAGSDRGTRWRIAAASVAGPNHVMSAVSNQDKLRVHRLDNGAMVFAVADGAGSRSRSEEGALCAVDAAVSAARHLFNGRLPANDTDWTTAAGTYFRTVVGHFDDQIDRRIGPAGGRSRDSARGEFATTLLAAIAAPPWYAFVSVGDCFLVVNREPGGPRLVVAADEREHAGATVFLTSAQRDRHTDIGVLLDHRISGIALCTDGLYEGMLMRRTGADGHAHDVAPDDFSSYFDYFGSDRNNPYELATKLQSKEFAASSGDDKTMVLAVRR